MRIEPYSVGSIVHVTQRGTRGMDIVRDMHDRERFIQLLYYFNDKYQDNNWRKATECLPFLAWPTYWPERAPIVRLLAWTLMPNHFHLLLEEIEEGGISKFMQRVCGSMSAYSNAKYKERGSLFQGSFNSRTVSEDTHLRYLAFYIQVKNVLELYPGGLQKAVSKFDFDTAWKWALRFRFSSLGTYVDGRDLPLTESGLLRDLYPNMRAFKKESREMLEGHIEHHREDDSLTAFLLEPW